MLQTLHKLYIKLYIEPRKPYTNASANPTQNGAQTLHCNGAQFYLGALLSRIRGRERKTRGRERKTRGRERKTRGRQIKIWGREIKI